MRRSRRQFTAQQKAAILREHLIDKIPISDLCDKHAVQPTIVYRWQKELFDQGGLVFERPNGSTDKRVKQLAAKAEALEAKLRRKDEVLSELMEEHLRTERALGDL